MAGPQIIDRTYWASNSTGSSRAVPLPTTGVADGDYYIVTGRGASAAAIVGLGAIGSFDSDWVEIATASGSGGDTILYYHEIVDAATDPWVAAGTVLVDNTSTVRLVSHSFLVRGLTAPPEATWVEGAHDANEDVVSPSINPSWGAGKDTTVILFFDVLGTDALFTAPTGYTADYLNTPSGSSGSSSRLQASSTWQEDQNAASFGGFTFTRTAGQCDYYHAFTIALAGETAAGGTAYDETGRTVAVAASISVADALTFDETSRSVSVAASLSVTDDLTPAGTAYDETGRTISISAAVSVTDALTYGEVGRPVAGAASVEVSDVFAGADTGLVVAASGAIGITDTLSASENRSVAVVGAVSSTDTSGATESLSVALTASVGASDSLGATENVSVAVAASLSVTDEIIWLEARSVAVVATVSVTDQHNIGEPVTIAITSSVTSTDQQSMVEQVSVAVTATTGISADFATHEDVSVAIVATVSVSDSKVYVEGSLPVSVSASVLAVEQLTIGEAGRPVTISGTTGVSDTVHMMDVVPVTIQMTVSVNGDARLHEFDLLVPVIATVTNYSAKHGSGTGPAGVMQTAVSEIEIYAVAAPDDGGQPVVWVEDGKGVVTTAAAPEDPVAEAAFTPGKPTLYTGKVISSS